jgi:formylmethanofuran dehydrogenase subunit B
MSPERTVEHVTCLGCGCGCDDLSVTIRDDRIVAAAPACPVGRAWLGDGQIPSACLIESRPAELNQAIARAATSLAGASGRLVLLAPDITSQAQRAALAIADLLGATVDTSTSETAAQGLLTAQRRGRTTATLGELRNRGDAFLFWGVDPSDRYPRFLARCGLDSASRQEGRRDVISVSVGADRGLSGAQLTLEVPPAQEIATLSLLRAAVLGTQHPVASPPAEMASQIASRLTAARYVVIVHDAEPTEEQRNPLRIEALLALAEALNGPTRAALCSLRGGGNRVGAEAVLTSQTGYPFAVDYFRGYPRTSPADRGIHRLDRGGFQAVLLVGSPSSEPAITKALSAVSTVLVGPRASQAKNKSVVAIDTGVAGVHEAGTAYRMDEVPLRLRPPLQSSRSTTQVLNLLTEALRAELGRTSR